MIQKKLSIIIFGGLLLAILIGWHLPSSADVVYNPDLIISQVKITTTGQFVSLYNNTDQTIDMSTVSLQYFNNYQLSAVTSTKNIQLSGNLPAHNYYIVNDGPINMCYQAMIQSVSLSFSTKAGQIEVVRLTQQSGGNISIEPQDFVRWSSTAAAGVQTIPAEPAFLQRQQTAGKPVIGSWQQVKPSSANPCQLVSSATPNTPVAPASQLLPPAPPSATIVAVESQKTSVANAGLMAPLINELLPNPASPQTDSKDEFIEIYNPNKTSFDLSGYKLQQAASEQAAKRTYTFPGGTTIPAQSFAAYPSSNISISLTNSSGLVWLLDASGKVIGQIEPYGEAKDGQAWALANGKWYWTAAPTPGAANVINQASSQKKSGTGVGTVKGTATTAPGSASSSNSSDKDAKPKSLNSAILVGVGVLALVYGLYEYRRDMANGVQKLKRNRAARRENRPKS